MKGLLLCDCFISPAQLRSNWAACGSVTTSTNHALVRVFPSRRPILSKENPCYGLHLGLFNTDVINCKAKWYFSISR